MSFFQQLHDISEAFGLTMRIVRKDDKLTISVLPDASNKMQPLIVTATPAELDEKFFELIAAPIDEAANIVKNSAAFVQNIQEQENLKAATEADNATNTVPKPAKAKDKPVKPPKPEPAAEKAKDPPAPAKAEVGSLF